ncbi:MAG TPA: flagellin [Steroidobacteraceae bacterium]|nr:flagellin [Steroidobacteraceae bacterium]
MSLVLNTNIDSMVAQNSLSSSGTQLASALQQLSSGLRINTAADDAAGYAISQGMTSQINGLNQAAQNANDGVSLAQTASGALSEVTTDLQTMRDLAVESLNATNSSQDRADLNAQFTQLAADINNVAATTQFNGVNLLDGSFQGADFQIGANAGQILSVTSISSAATSAIGNIYTTGSGGAGGAAYTLTPAANNGDQVSVSLSVTPAASATNPTPTAITVNAGTVTLTGTQSTDLANMASAINQALGSSYGIVATVDSSGAINLSSSNAAAQTVAVTVTDGTAAAGGTDTESAAELGLAGSYALGSVGAAAAPPTGSTTGASTLSNLGVTTVDQSNLVLISVDNALQQLATSGADLGAYQNRFQAAISGLNTDSTNLTAAKSAIVDTDYAAATSNLSKAQILQQASTAMVAQANTIPQNILTLLQKLP